MSQTAQGAGREQGQRLAPSLRPATDIIEREDGFYIYVDLPGVAKDSLQLTIQGDQLILVGPIRENVRPNERYVSIEFGGGEFRQRFTMPASVDRRSIRATLENGVLELYMPNSGRSGPRRIEVWSER